MIPRGYNEVERIYENEDIDDEQLFEGISSREISERNAGDDSDLLDQERGFSRENGNLATSSEFKTDSTLQGGKTPQTHKSGIENNVGI